MPNSFGGVRRKSLYRTIKAVHQTNRAFYTHFFAFSLFLIVSIVLSSCGSKKKLHQVRPQMPSEIIETSRNNVQKNQYIPLNYSEKPEMRAVWVTTIYGLDWPKTKGSTYSAMKTQQKELVEILDDLKKANFNTVFFQVRLRGDLLYPSRIEPQADILTGNSFISCPYDPLAFAIEECHKRGIALHAWLVTFPLGNRTQVNKLGKTGIAKKRPEWIIYHNGEYYLDPGIPEVRDYLSKIVGELVSNYEVDGVHFDYIRYPDNAGSFRDQKTYKRFAPKGMSKAEWREDNINRFLAKAFNTVSKIRPSVLVSAAPLGRYREIPGEKASGWTAKESVHQDPQAWFQQGSVDFVVPMMYHSGDLFDPFVRDWKEQMKGGIVIPGLGAYRTQEKKAWNREIILQQMDLIREEGLSGVCFYRQANISSTRNKTLWKKIAERFEIPVRPLTFNRHSAPIPGTPYFRFCEIVDDELRLTWEPSAEKDGTTSYNLFFNLYDKKGHPQEDYLFAPSLRSREYRIPLSIFPPSGRMHLRLEAANSFNQVGRASSPLIIDLKEKSFVY